MSHGGVHRQPLRCWIVAGDEVDIDEIVSGRRAPVAEQHVLGIRERQRPLQQQIVEEMNLGD
jgi:hypothetical protein